MCVCLCLCVFACLLCSGNGARLALQLAHEADGRASAGLPFTACWRIDRPLLPLAMRLLSPSPCGQSGAVRLTHRHAALGSTELLPLQSGRVAFKVPTFLVPPMISVLRSAIGRPARELRHRADGTCALFFRRRPRAAPRVHRFARGLGSPRRPTSALSGKDIGQRTPPRQTCTLTGRSRSFRCSACRASLRTPVMCAVRPPRPAG